MSTSERLNGAPRRRPLTFAEAAEYLNTTERKVRRLWAERRIDGYKLDRKVLINPDSLDRLLAASEVTAK